MGETLRISAPTVLDSVLGRATLEAADRRLEQWSERLLRQAGVELTVSGRERVDAARPYVVMSNHRSHYDVPILFQAWPGRLRMVAKTELYKIPLFGPAMRVAGFIELDRSNRERAIESLRGARPLFDAGLSVWIAPEGTRSRDVELRAFKKGGFMMALDAGLPVVPVGIAGSDEVLAPHARSVNLGQRVHVSIGAPLALPEGDGHDARDRLVESVREAMRALVEDARQQLRERG